MSWAIAGNWLAVAGLLLLTIGTRAQARASLAEFKRISKELAKRKAQYRGFFAAEAITQPMLFPILIISRILTRLRYLFMRSETLESIRVEYDDQAAEYVLFSQQSLIWSILNIGSALALIAATIQLTLSY